MIYSFNMFMIALGLHFIYRYVGNEKRNISTLSNEPLLKKFSYQRGLWTAFIFLLGALLCIPDWTWASWTARFVFFLIPVAFAVLNRKAKKSLKKAVNEK
jgi:hypothetical protein